MTGTGTELDPYIIETTADFDDLYLDPSAFYVLGTDLDYAGGTAVNTRNGFTGDLNLDGHSVINIGGFTNEFGSAASTWLDIQGGSVYDGEFHFDMNVDLGSVTVMDPDNIGVIDNIKLSGSITNTGVISPVKNSGGSIISNFYSQIVQNSTGSDVYGLTNLTQGGTTINNALVFGSLTAFGTAYGISGTTTFGAINTSYWDQNTTGTTTSDDGTGLTTAQAQDFDTYNNAGWDIVLKANHDGQKATALWFIEDGVDYPRLWFEWDGTPPPSVTIKVWTGAAFEDKPVTYWDGSSWTAPSSIKTYNGTDFV